MQLEMTNTYTLCRPTGSLDVDAAVHLREAMAVVTPAAALVVDLSEVPFIDSAALAALVAGIRRVRDGGGGAAVCSTRPHVTKVLKMIGLERVVPIVGNVQEAERIVAAMSAPADPTE